MSTHERGWRSSTGGSIAWSMVGLCLLLAGSAETLAQDTAQEDAQIDTIRQLGQIPASDQRRIADWVQAQVDRLAGTPAAERQAAAIKFRSRFREQNENTSNSAAFKQQFPVQTAAVAVTQFGNASLDSVIARALGRVLVELTSPETMPALLAGLKSSDAATRYLCAEGIAAQRTTIASDKDRLEQTIRAIREAALAETSSVVLGRLYLALSVPPNQIGAVFETVAAILEKRLQERRGRAVIADGAEIDAYEFFRVSAALNALNQQQKEQLVRVLAGFMRADARRYSTPELTFEEIDKLERMMDAEEEILTSLVGSGKGGNIRDALAGGGYANRGEAFKQAILWVGDAETNQPGVLSAAPWNVPVGAP